MLADPIVCILGFSWVGLTFFNVPYGFISKRRRGQPIELEARWQSPIRVRLRQKSIALFIDDAHDLHSKTLIGLKRLLGDIPTKVPNAK